MAGEAGHGSQVRYEAGEKPPVQLAAALGAQTVALIVAGIVLTPIIVLRAAGVADEFGPWAVFMALIVSGLITIVQGVKLWRIGAGYVLFMGTSGAFMSVSVTAIVEGSIALLMTLIVASSLLQFPLAANLGLLRKIITPAVGGTTIMLISVTIMPIAYAMLQQVPAAPDGNPGDLSGAAISAGVTFAIIIAVSLFGRRSLRLWSPLFGLIVGSAVASFFGLLDLSKVAGAAWIGVPDWNWPGLDLSFGPVFWQLLPAFLIVTLVGAIETFGDGIAIQRSSWRTPRAVDFRSVQGAVFADGAGNLLSGLGGTLPNTTYSTSIAVVDMTGVAARSIAVWGGSIMVCLAFSPKLAQLLLTVPSPVAGAYIVVLLVLLFMHGINLVMQDGLTFENSLVVGLGFWLGVGFQQKALFYDLMPSWMASLLSNGMTSGTIAAIVLTLLLRLKTGQRQRIEAPLVPASLKPLHDFAQRLAVDAGWDRPASNRLQLAVEELFLVLLDQKKGEGAGRLRIEARREAETIVLDIVAGPQGANLEDELPRQAQREPDAEDALSYRILNSIVDDLRHQQYHGIEFLTLRLSSRPL